MPGSVPETDLKRPPHIHTHLVSVWEYIMCQSYFQTSHVTGLIVFDWFLWWRLDFCHPSHKHTVTVMKYILLATFITLYCIVLYYIILYIYKLYFLYFCHIFLVCLLAYFKLKQHINFWSCFSCSVNYVFLWYVHDCPFYYIFSHYFLVGTVMIQIRTVY